jgi:adenine phosphoribosyltransferase
VVMGMEARGFIFGAPVALALGVGFVPVRKPSKLPRATLTASYDLEYGYETLAVHADAIAPGARVLIVDDVLATGGTIAATADLVRRLGARLAGVTVVMELGFLSGREFLARRGIRNVTALCVAEA